MIPKKTVSEWRKIANWPLDGSIIRQQPDRTNYIDTSF